MKTRTTIFSTLLLIFFFPASFIPQASNNKAISKTTTVPMDDVSSLLNEVNAMRGKAQQLRVKAASAKGLDSVTIVVYAEQLEKKCFEKHLHALALDFSINSRIYADNTDQIKLTQQKNPTRTHNEHILFLMKESVKNKKVADDLFDEVSKLGSMSVKLGQLSNAEEKILEALEQQNQVLELLRKPSTSLAARN